MDPRKVIINWKFLHRIFSNNNNIPNIVPQVGSGKGIPSTQYLQHLEILGNLEELKCRLVILSYVVTARVTSGISCVSKYRNDFDEEVSCHDCHQA